MYFKWVETGFPDGTSTGWPKREFSLTAVQEKERYGKVRGTTQKVPGRHAASQALFRIFRTFPEIGMVKEINQAAASTAITSCLN
jgi:hypothetical protein